MLFVPKKDPTAWPCYPQHQVMHASDALHGAQHVQMVLSCTPVELLHKPEEQASKRAANSRRRANKPARCGSVFPHAERKQYVGGSGRKWAELVRISTWLHDVHVEDGAQARCGRSRWISCNDMPATIHAVRRAKCGSGSGGMDERRHGRTWVL